MVEDKWFGIPRNKIKWNPKINYKKCTGCMTCVNFCAHGVFAERDNKPLVANPENCIVGCTGCDDVCPQKAISHPSKSYLSKLTKQKDFSGCSCEGACS